MLKKRVLNDPVTYPEKFSEKASSICDGLLVREVDKRLGFKNGSCDELRAHAFFSNINWRKLNAGLFQASQHHLEKMFGSSEMVVVSITRLFPSMMHLCRDPHSPFSARLQDSLRQEH